MPILVEWFDATEKAILATVKNPWTWEEARQSRIQIVQLAQSVHHNVTLIEEFAADVSIPPGGFPQAMKDAIEKHQHANLYRVIYVLHNPGLIPMWESALSTYNADPDRYNIVRTQEEALHYIE